IPTYIYVNNVRYSVGSCVDIDKGTYSISADIPTGYSFVNWESMFGNIVFYNPNVLNTQFTLNGNDTIILRLQYTVAPPTPPPAVYYNITCYIVDENNTAIPGAKILLDNIQCSHSQRITVSSGTYTLNTLLPANYTFYMYESDLYIYYPKSKITSVIVNKDGYIKSIIKYYPYGYLPELPPESIIKDITSFGQLLLLLSILIIGAVFSMFGNLPIGVSFIVSGILFTFLPSDALGYFLLGVSAVITYFIVRAIIK
ncbi:MAG: carboxypeptidase-like regulatory domain-containing protein, partial [Candidatus Bathyarchaeia archaeon]